MRFNIGDIISASGLYSNYSARRVIDVDTQKKLYRLQFLSGRRMVNVWCFEEADRKFTFVIPGHIPVEQHERYRKMKWKI